ncbi:T9SS type A sorting domain-containing protein [Aquimarina sp. 2201CG1-2-11]|uniref:T9SS type A sorting domain-containing protein n=1 Tax=Aquimarina discodermiae TaxID=3231043 RepID=UPI0034627452
MKKIILILVLFMSLQSVNSQTFVIDIEGYISKSGSECGSAGLTNITYVYEDGDRVTAVLDQGPYNDIFGKDYSAKGKEFASSNKIVEVVFTTKKNEKPLGSGCKQNGDLVTRRARIFSYCGERTHTYRSIYMSGFTGYATIKITPKLTLSYSSGTPIDQPHVACDDVAIGIEATSGFTPENQVYKWEFWNEYNLEEVPTAEYQVVLDKLDIASEIYQSCVKNNSGPGGGPGGGGPDDPDWPCADVYNEQQQAFMEMIEYVQQNEGNLYDYLRADPGWNVITSKTGQSKIDLLLEDMYPVSTVRDDIYNTNVRDNIYNKNIRVRYNSECSNSGELTLIYLRKPPVAYENPQVVQPQCAGGTGQFVFNFDRGLEDGEHFYINLINVATGVSAGNVTYDPGDGDPSPIIESNGKWTFTFENVSAGTYRLHVAGYISNNNPTCETIYPRGGSFFTITQPQPVEFTAEINNHQQCHERNDGEIEINVTSGSFGTNQYSLDEGVNWTSFTGSRVVIGQLAPTTYSILVRNGKGCFAKNADNSNKIIRRTIDGVDKISHDVGTVTHPSSASVPPNIIADASIRINEISGGKPKSDANGDYYDVVVKINGSNTNIRTYRGDFNGFEILGLPAGTHIVEYKDANDCSFTDVLPTIIDPDPIDFDIEVTRDCTNDRNGNITINNIIGGYPKPNGTYNITWYKDETPDVLNSNRTSITPSLGASYRVVVTDTRNGEAVRDNLSIPNNIAVNDSAILITHNTIFGSSTGSIDLTTAISGGVTPYVIRWTQSGDPTYSALGSRITNLFAGEYTATINDATGECPVTKIIRVSEPEELNVVINETVPMACFGDKATLSAQIVGGVPAYTYEWFRNTEGTAFSTAASIDQLDTGTYRVEVRDIHGAFATATVVLTEPALLELVAVSKTDISCFGANDGTIVLSPQGGTRPYSFSIDNKVSYISENDLNNLTIEGLGIGDYEVWLQDANGCEIVSPKSITLDAPEAIIVTPTIVHATTVGGTNGSITIDVAGNVGTTSFAWTKQGDTSFNRTTRDIINLSFGMYTVAVTDTNGCMIQDTFEVKEPLPLKVAIAITTPILCHADALGELTANVEGGYPIDSTPADFDYQWFKIENGTDIAINTDLTLTSIENMESGSYKVVVNDSQGATAETTIVLSEPDDLVVTLTSTPINVLCYGEATGAIDITVTGGPKDANTGEYLPYTFNWTKEGDPVFIVTTEDLENIEAGTYQVVVIDDNLCTTSLSETVVIAQPDAALEISNVVVTDLTGYQTGNGSITLDVSGGTPPYVYEWMDTQDASFTASTKDIFNLPQGNYQLTVTDAHNCSTGITELVTEPEELIVRIETLTAAQSIQCHGERTVIPLTTTINGGVGNYTYEWYEQADPTTILFTASATSTTVLTGTYIVVVTDANGNTASDSYEVLEPEVLTTTEEVTHLQCAGDSNGSIDVTTVGGVPPYNYLWSNGATTEDLTGSISAGNYTLEVTDANNCVFRKTITIDQPPVLFVAGGDIIRLYPSANGLRDGSITITIGGGVLPYSYEWRDSNGVIPGATTNVLSDIGVEKYAVTITDANGCTLVIDDVDIFEPPALEANIRLINVISCNGATTGSISADVIGGRPFNNVKQYNYQWFNADTGLPVGNDNFLLENIGSANYYVVVSDAVGTTVTSAPYFLAQPNILELSLSADYNNCGDANDWTITPEIIGGTPPYTYMWSNGVTSALLTDVAAATYILTVIDSRGCSVDDQLEINVPDELVAPETITIPNCYNGCDGNIVLATAGGAAPYTYVWSNGSTQKDIDNLCSGTYTVTITDRKGCEIVKEIVVDNPDELIVDLGEDITLCKDQSIFINATIVDENATYEWTATNGFSSDLPAIEVSETAVYTVLVTDSKGCVATDDIFVNATDDVIDANFIASTQVFVGEEFVVVDNSDPIPDRVEWTFPEEATVTYTDTNYAEAYFDEPGEYEITMQTYKGLCTEITSKKVIVIEKEFDEEGGEGTTQDIESFIEYLVYPNPTNNGRFKVDINLSKSNAISLKTFNMVNNTLIDTKEGTGNDSYSFDYDMSLLPSGVYFVLLETPTASQVRKLIIE